MRKTITNTLLAALILGGGALVPMFISSEPVRPPTSASVVKKWDIARVQLSTVVDAPESNHAIFHCRDSVMVKTGDQCNRELADWLGLSPNGLGPKFSFTQMMVDDGWELVSHGYVFPTREIGRTNITMNLDVFHYRREAK